MKDKISTIEVKHETIKPGYQMQMSFLKPL